MSTSRHIARALLRPMPYVLSASVVGAVFLFRFHPDTSSSTVALDPKRASFPKPQRGNAAIQSAYREVKKYEIPYTDGPPVTVTGPLVNIKAKHPFGKLRVRATMTQGVLTEVKIAHIETYDGRSGEIADFSTPTLIVNSVSKNTAKVDSVSSATYTSEAYATSLQAAIDQVR